MSRLIEMDEQALRHTINEAVSQVVATLFQPAAPKAKPRAATIRATAQVGDAIMCATVATLTRAERNALFSLMLYVAEEQDVRLDRIKACVEERFDLPHLAHLRTQQFQDCVDFLLSLRMDEL